MVGETISHYRILAQIGAGGMGVVYKAYDQQLEREVALKLLPQGLLADEAARKRFRKEALALARLNHPNIATIFEFGNEDGLDFLVTEYIPGITLDTKLSSGPLNTDEAIRLGVQLATGLAEAHSQGLIHRDLKPGNLRVAPDGRLKILDFGLAELAPRLRSDDVTASLLTQTSQYAGTLPYMAPEQLRGAIADARTDIWAAGAVLYEMATGKRPFPESGAPLLINAILNSNPVPTSQINKKVPPGLDQVVLKALQKDPTRRYQTAFELRSDLERFMAGTLVLQKPKTHFIWPAVLVFFVVVFGLAGYFVTRTRSSGGRIAQSRPSVAVLGFKSLGAGKQQDWLSTALSEMLTTELAAGDKLRTVPGENVARAKADLALPDAESLAADTLAKVHNILGANLIVLGSYLDLDGQIRVDVRVQSASAGEIVARFSQVGTEAQLFDLVRQLGRDSQK